MDTSPKLNASRALIQAAPQACPLFRATSADGYTCPGTMFSAPTSFVCCLRVSEARGRGDAGLSCQFETEGISIVLKLKDEGNAAAAMLPWLLDRTDTEVVANAKSPGSNAG